MAQKRSSKRGKSRAPHQQGTNATPASRGSSRRPNDRIIWGTHPVMAALANPDRQIEEIYLLKDLAPKVGPEIDQLLSKRKIDPPIFLAAKSDIEAICAEAVEDSSYPTHQGLVARVQPLDDLGLDDIAGINDSSADLLVVILDQVTDPHNLGAIMRSASVFGAQAVIVQDRNSPKLTPTLLKSASGAGDAIPLVRVTNIARTVEDLAEMGVTTVGLAAEGTGPLSNLAPHQRKRVALVMGAEGSGIRRLVRERCDQLAYLPQLGGLSHLNVSNAAAVALYEVIRDREVIETAP